MPKKAGRPTKLTPEMQEEIVKVLRAGNFIETAAAYVGINQSTLRDWMRRGTREKSGKYAAFSKAVKKALAEAEVMDVARIGQASKEQWQAAAWRLERRNWRRWGRKQIIEVQPSKVSESDVMSQVQQMLDATIGSPSEVSDES